MKSQEIAHYATICGCILLLALCILGMNIPMIWRVAIVLVEALVIGLLIGPYPGYTPFMD